MNKGDTITIYLNYTVDGVPITEGQFDEIEFCIGSKRFTLTGQQNTITWDSEYGAYCVSLSQTDTFALALGSKYQLRLQKDGKVISSGINILKIGNTISNKTI